MQEGKPCMHEGKSWIQKGKSCIHERDHGTRDHRDQGPWGHGTRDHGTRGPWDQGPWEGPGPGTGVARGCVDSHCRGEGRNIPQLAAAFRSALEVTGPPLMQEAEDRDFTVNTRTARHTGNGPPRQIDRDEWGTGDPQWEIGGT